MKEKIQLMNPDPDPVQKGPKIQGEFNSANSGLVDNYGKLR